jgi:hypothetical protein
MDEPLPARAYRCRFKQCPNAGQRFTRSELDSHRRKVHGLDQIGMRDRRPEGGTIPCDYVDPVTGKPCIETQLYRTMGGLGSHKSRVHKLESVNPATISRQLRRGAVRKEQVATQTESRLDTGQRNHLRRMLRSLIFGQLANMFKTSGEVIRDTIGELCATNLEDPAALAARIDPHEAYSLSSTPGKSSRRVSQGNSGA